MSETEDIINQYLRSIQKGYGNDPNRHHEIYSQTLHYRNNYREEVLFPFFERLSLEPQKPYAFLDAGSGTGEYADIVYSYFNNYRVKVVNIDVNENALRLNQGISVIADMHHLPISDQSIDVINAKDTLPHIRDKMRTYSEWRRVIKENGWLLVASAETSHQYICRVYEPETISLSEGDDYIPRHGFFYDREKKREFRELRSTNEFDFFKYRSIFEKAGKIVSLPYYRTKLYSELKALEDHGFECIDRRIWNQGREVDWYLGGFTSRFIIIARASTKK